MPTHWYSDLLHLLYNNGMQYFKGYMLKCRISTHLKVLSKRSFKGISFFKISLVERAEEYSVNSSQTRLSFT